jgi:hypothetical protein
VTSSAWRARPRHYRSPIRRILAFGAALEIPALALSMPTGASASPAAATTVGPDIPTVHVYHQTIPVNIVLVGYDKAEVGPDIMYQLAPNGAPQVRYPLYYGLQGRNLGLDFRYRYHLMDAGKRFDNQYFHYLTKIGTPSDLTTYQQAYNDQTKNVLDVTGPILNIDGPTAETWLERHAQAQLGLTNHSYTVFLVNWWGQPNFKFHVYRKTNEPDPDTGKNFGELNSRGLIAWGGSTGRSWLYDLSAGPEAWTGNWNVDNADVDGDGVPDYRMPPIWEYTKGGYRSRYKLGSDLGTIVRYVAVNLLFTSSPLYDPLVTAPKPGGQIAVRNTMFEDNPDGSGTNWVDPASSLGMWRALEPYHRFSTTFHDVNPITAGPKRTYRIFANLNPGTGACWEQYGDTFAQPYCYFHNHQGQYYPDQPLDHEVGVFSLFTTDENMGSQLGLLGYADDNWVDGTQSYVFTFDYPEALSGGYGFTTTVTHEVGHHLGLSHPHDGYDPTTGVDYGGVGDSYFTWVGDESNTVMHYLAVSNSFGRFDKDNMDRYWFAGYANWTKDLITSIKSSGSTNASTRAAIRSARGFLRRATSAFYDWHYLTAASAARHAYVIAQKQADVLHVGKLLVPTQFQAPAGGNAPHEGDPVRFPND